jgi:2-dehydropantoate 2-reductase
MGAALAADATDAGLDVTLIDVDAALVDHIHSAGVEIEDDRGIRRTNVPATVDADSAGSFDLAMIFVKGYHTRAAAAAAARVCGPDTVAVTLQNGWGNGDVLAAHIPATQVVIGVTYHSCSSAGPGRVRHTGRGPTLVGPYAAGSTVGADRAAAFLSDAGWSATVSNDVRAEIWKKLVLNAATLPTAALTGLSAARLGTAHAMRALVEGLAGETVAVARAQGLDIDLDERIARIHAVLANAGDGKASMLQDVEARRATEIATVNGAVVEIGARLGVATPLNETVVALLRGLERSWRP